MNELPMRCWRMLRSRNLAIVVMAAAAILIILGLMLPQPDRVGPQAYSIWREANPLFAQYAEFFGLNQLFSTWWFLAVAVLLYLNTLACTVNQIQSGLQRFLAKPGQPAPNELQSMTQNFATQLSLSSERAVEIVSQSLRQNGFRPQDKRADGLNSRVSDDEEDIAYENYAVDQVDPYDIGEPEVATEEDLTPSSVRLYAEKGRLGLFGSPLLHLGLVMALTAVGWSGLTQFTGFVEAGEGQTFTEAKGTYQQETVGPLFGDRHAGFEVQIDRIEVEANSKNNQDLDQPVRTFITIIDQGVDVLSGILEVNSSLEYRGVRLYQTRLFGPGVIFLLRYADGRLNQGMVNLAVAADGQYTNLTSLPGTVYQAEISQSDDANSVRLNIRDRSKESFSGGLKVGETLQLDDGVSLMLVDVRRWTSIRVVNDQSQWLLFSGFFVTLLGMALSWLYTRQQVWTVVEGNGAGSYITCAGRANRARALFAGKFAQIESSIQNGVDQALKGESWGN